jgi:hypothetical protein
MGGRSWYVKTPEISDYSNGLLTGFIDAVAKESNGDRPAYAGTAARPMAGRGNAREDVGTQNDETNTYAGEGIVADDDEY